MMEIGDSGIIALSIFGDFGIIVFVRSSQNVSAIAISFILMTYFSVAPNKTW